MNIKLNEKGLNKVTGGSGEYNKLIKDINTIKDDLPSFCKFAIYEWDYTNAYKKLDDCVIALKCDNKAEAKQCLNSAIASLKIISTKYHNLSYLLDTVINNLTSMCNRI